MTAASAVLLFCSSCLNDELHGTVVRMNQNRTYTLSDTALVYNFYDESVDASVIWMLDVDTVVSTRVKYTFSSPDEAAECCKQYADDHDIVNISSEGSIVLFTTICYNGLSVIDIIQILRDIYLYSEPSTDIPLDSTRAFYFNNISDDDGAYVILLHSGSEDNYIYGSNTLIGRHNISANTAEAEVEPWRLFRNGDGWQIRLSNGKWLRRSGSGRLPLALTTTTLRDYATSWTLSNVIAGKNVWTFSSTPDKTDEFYGFVRNSQDALSVETNKVETFSLLTSPVTVTLISHRDTAFYEALWGSTFRLPDAASPADSVTFIGWNTTDNRIEGFLPAGTPIEADNDTLFAIFVKSE